MKVLKLVTRNAFRRRLRTFLTILGIALAVMAFGLIRSFINAWYSGARAASPNRLITRHAVSVVFTLPIAYKEQLLKIDGVTDVTYAIWFGGVYVDTKNFFPQMGVDQTNFFEIYSELDISAGQREAFKKERRAAIIGQKLADRFGWKVGDKVSLIGTIYPGNWDFVIRGIYSAKSKDTDETLFFFRFDYVDEVMKEQTPGRVGQIGWYAVKIDDPSRAGAIGREIDGRFDNSWAETRTETEKEFQMSFIELAGTIIVGMRLISYLIIGVILLVLANTMAMTARERTSEYAFMKTLGFRAYHLVGLIMGESICIALLGGLLGMGLMAASARMAAVALSQFFPGFGVDPVTYVLSMAAAVLVGLAAALFPIQRAVRISIVEGLRVVD